MFLSPAPAPISLSAHTGNAHASRHDAVATHGQPCLQLVRQRNPALLVYSFGAHTSHFLTGWLTHALALPMTTRYLASFRDMIEYPSLMGSDSEKEYCDGFTDLLDNILRRHAPTVMTIATVRCALRPWGRRRGGDTWVFRRASRETAGGAGGADPLCFTPAAHPPFLSSPNRDLKRCATRECCLALRATLPSTSTDFL